MGKFKHALAARDAHISTLRLIIALMLLLLAAMWYGWQSSPRSLTVYNPPDLRAGSTRPWWEVPPGEVYAFGFYIFQQLNRWPVNGEEDYPRTLNALSAYLTPSCHAQLEQDYRQRRDLGELRDRVRGVYEIPGRGFQHNRVQVLDRDHWIATFDLTVDEYYQAEPVKRALVRYPLNIVRYGVDAEKNPWGLALDCFASQPQKLEAATAATTPEKKE